MSIILCFFRIFIDFVLNNRLSLYCSLEYGIHPREYNELYNKRLLDKGTIKSPHSQLAPP